MGIYRSSQFNSAAIQPAAPTQAYDMAMKTGVFVALLIAALSVAATAQSSSTCDYVIRKVSFENTTGLTASQRTRLAKLLVGNCFQIENPGVLSEAVFHQLRSWGYNHAEVIDPDKGHDIRILDETARPTPVAVTIDFRLDASTTAR
jgi:hypothetical protein